MDQIKTAEYVERMTRELCAMAKDQGLDFLAYLLEMAREEAAREMVSIKIESKDES